MGRLRNQMKWPVGFVVCDRGMLIDREFTIQIRGKHRMDRAVVYMPLIAMAMVGLGMDMDQWRGEHPYGCPHENRHPRPRYLALYRPHCGFSLAQFCGTINRYNH